MNDDQNKQASDSDGEQSDISNQSKEGLRAEAEGHGQEVEDEGPKETTEAQVLGTKEAAEDETAQTENIQPTEASDNPVAEDSKPATDEQPAASANPLSTSDNPNARWYIIHTYSGHENRVAATLRQRVESEHLQDKILDILVPTQDKIEIRSGKKETVQEKIFPGYILVKMALDDNSWMAVRTTQGVTSFVGISNKPTPIPESEVQTIIRFMKQEGQPTFKQIFSEGDTIKIVDGPFAEFIGKVDNVDKERGKVKVLVSIFGRETPVELDFLQVAKL